MIIQENPNLMDLFECHQKCAMFEGGHIYNIYIYIKQYHMEVSYVMGGTPKSSIF